MFPIAAIEGTSHMSYMTGSPPAAVKIKDLKPAVDEKTAHQEISAYMLKYLDTIVNKAKFDTKDSDAIIAPLIEAMKMEGYYGMKPPCYFEPLVNAQNVTCLHGSPWHDQYSQSIMAGSFNNNTMINTNTDDNFHLVQDTHPIHLATINNTCDGTKNCTLDSITVSQNLYSNISTSTDTGYYPIAATEQKVKLMSRQAFWTAGGVEDPDFTALDEDGNRCGDIN